MLIRSIEPGDAEALSALAKRTFTDTFGHLYPSEHLQAFLTASHDTHILEAELAAPDQFWRMAWDGDQAAAYLHACPVSLPHREADSARQGEIKRIYVDASRQGLGLGKQLLDLGFEYLSQRYGDTPQWIGVWSGNLKAQAIYRARGFEKAGEYGFEVGETTDLEFILRKG